MREFVTAVQEAYEGEADEGQTMKLDGRELTYYKPAEGQFMVFMASTSRHSSTQEQIAAVVNFFVELFDKDSQAHLVERLLDREDPFGIEQINNILDALAEDWSGRPTQPSTASTRSRKSGGRKSTPSTPQLISSDSQSTGS